MIFPPRTVFLCRCNAISHLLGNSYNSIFSFLLCPAWFISSFLVFVLDTCLKGLVILDCSFTFQSKALRRWLEALSTWRKLVSQWPPHPGTSRFQCVEILSLGKNPQILIPGLHCWHSVSRAREESQDEGRRCRLSFHTHFYPYATPHTPLCLKCPKPEVFLFNLSRTSTCNFLWYLMLSSQSLQEV